MMGFYIAIIFFDVLGFHGCPILEYKQLFPFSQGLQKWRALLAPSTTLGSPSRQRYPARSSQWFASCKWQWKMETDYGYGSKPFNTLKNCLSFDPSSALRIGRSMSLLSTSPWNCSHQMILSSPPLGSQQLSQNLRGTAKCHGWPKKFEPGNPGSRVAGETFLFSTSSPKDSNKRNHLFPHGVAGLVTRGGAGGLDLGIGVERIFGCVGVYKG